MRRSVTFAATAAVAALLLTGCANPLEQLAQGGAEELVEEITGVDVGIGGTASVPADFPSDILLPEGNPVTSLSVPEGWQLTYSLPVEEAQRIFDAIKNDPAYTVEGETDMGEMLILITANADHRISLSLILPEGEPAQLSYIVSPLT